MVPGFFLLSQGLSRVFVLFQSGKIFSVLGSKNTFRKEKMLMKMLMKKAEAAPLW